MADLNRYDALKRPLRAALGQIARPRRWAAYGPLVLVIGAFLVLALFGLIDQLPDIAHVALLAAAIVGAGLALVRGLIAYKPPEQDEALRLLDASDPSRPVSTLLDRPSQPDRVASEVWQAHRERAVEKIRTLRPRGIGPLWAKVDPLGLRALVPALILAGLLVAGPLSLSRLERALSPDIGALFGGGDIEVVAWVTPPPYTGKPPLYLTDDLTDLTLPEGSELTVRANSRSAPRLVMEDASGDQTRTRLSRAADGGFETTTTLTAPVTVSVDWWGDRGSWALEVTPDNAPTVVWTSRPALGERDTVAFSYELTDDYGVSGLFVEIALSDTVTDLSGDPTRNEVDMADIFPTRSTDDVAIDLTRHKWVGVEVDMTLVAVDAAGKEGRSVAHRFVLPPKLFFQPLAKATQEVRLEILRASTPYKDVVISPAGLSENAFNAENALERAPERIQRASLMLDALTYEGAYFIDDMTVYFGLRRALGVTRSATSLEDLAGLDELLWSVTMRAEYGDSGDAMAAFLAAKRALETALRDGATEQEIKRLTEAFRKAAEDLIAAKIAEALANGPSDAGPDAEENLGQQLGSGDVEDMLKALEDLAETGASDAARQMLSDVANLLENLEFEMGQPGEGGFDIPEGGEGGEDGDPLPEGERALQGALDRLSELLSQQRNLNDDTLRGGEPGPPSQQQQPMGEQGDGETRGSGTEGGIGGEGEMSLADRQEQLRQDLERFAEQMRDSDGTAGALSQDQIEGILQAQRRAQSALERGDREIARWSQERVVRELRDAARSLAEELDVQRASRLGQSGAPNEQDPLGRPIANGANDGDQVAVPDEIDRQRAKDILDELRRRLGISEDELEQEYLERLLDRF